MSESSAPQELESLPLEILQRRAADLAAAISGPPAARMVATMSRSAMILFIRQHSE